MGTKEWKFHELKTTNPGFKAIVAGTKTHELRRNDRWYSVGHILRLFEWENDLCTGRTIDVEVTYISSEVHHGLQDEFVVMSIRTLLEVRPMSIIGHRIGEKG